MSSPSEGLHPSYPLTIICWRTHVHTLVTRAQHFSPHMLYKNINCNKGSRSTGHPMVRWPFNEVVFFSLSYTIKVFTNDTYHSCLNSVAVVSVKFIFISIKRLLTDLTFVM